MSWKYWKRGLVLAVALAVLLPVVAILYLGKQHVPTELELRAFLSANRDGLNCFRVAAGKSGEATRSDDPQLLLAATACGLDGVVAVRRWQGSRPWRLVMFEKPRFSALNGMYELGFAFGDGAPSSDEKIVSGFQQGFRGSTNFIPLEDGWALFEVNF